MAYFANATEGDIWEQRYCQRCANYNDTCAILDVHFLYNYEACRENGLAKRVLDGLIPDTTDGPGECMMYRKCNCR
jgi:hypothetical protein